MKFYVKHQWGGGKASEGFIPDKIRTLVSMATDNHKVIMGKTASSHFLECFLSDPFHTFFVVVFRSPEPKANGELKVYRSSRRPCVSSSIHPSVNIFRHKYLCNQLADSNEILCEASLGWGKGFRRF